MIDIHRKISGANVATLQEMCIDHTLGELRELWTEEVYRTPCHSALTTSTKGQFLNLIGNLHF